MLRRTQEQARQDSPRLPLTAKCGDGSMRRPRGHRAAAALTGFLGVLLVAGCSGAAQGDVSRTTIVATLPTYAPNLFTGNVSCGGVGWSNVRLSVSPDHAPQAYLMSTATPEAVLGGPYELTWPPGYSLTLGGSGAEIIGPNGTPVLPDGAIIDEMGVCPWANGQYVVWNVGPARTP